jgi:hydrogenase expression/formation protein HypD
MRYLDEYRDAEPVRRYAAALAKKATRPWTVMEVCGGQTHAIVRYGIDTLLPPGVELIHGPGCPVCVTPVGLVDAAIAIARTGGVIFTSFGDMLRVPGTRTDLLSTKAQGADVRAVYSPLDAVRIARENPDRQVVFFAVGFETTAPANAVAVLEAKPLGLENFSLLVSHVLVPPALRAILDAPGNRVQGFLAAGHVCTVMGVEEYVPIAREYRVPIVVTGFEPVDLLQGMLLCVTQLEEGRAEVENPYSRAVRRDGNEAARRAMAEVFEIVPRAWRGIGTIPESGLALRAPYARFDALRRFPLPEPDAAESSACIAGEVLRGLRKPAECPAFGGACTPETPLGAPMVSSEGACAAYYRYRRVRPLPASRSAS